MRILAIETSCDETAVAVLHATEEADGTHFTVLGNALLSQIELHKEYGGVFPALAKREHAKNLVPLLEAALSEAELLVEDTQALLPSVHEAIVEILGREPGLTELFLSAISEMEVPKIDAIAVTSGPGLSPALWVGVNFARALSAAWNVPLVSVNHMEGHIISALGTTSDKKNLLLPTPPLPLLSLLISGGHTELVLSESWLSYSLLGQTRDDAVGEAFDKVARMLDLPYPGGPEVSRLAEKARSAGATTPTVTLPRPMIHDPNFDFSFSGLKTAVLYLSKDKNLTEEEKEQLAWAFEEAAADVLYAKTRRALEETGAQSLALGGGVSANTHIQRVFTERLKKDMPYVSLYLPQAYLTGDNAIMIALAGYYRAQKGEYIERAHLVANGNMRLV